MPVGIGAGGFVGLGLESTPGTYASPDKFFPIRSENLLWQQETNWRRVIRGTADVIGAVPGDGHVEGDIETEALEDVLPWFLAIARGTLTEDTGVYTFVPSNAAVPSRTASITVVRNDVVFGYTGIVVSSMSFTIDNGMLVSSFSLLGQEEEEQSAPTPTYDDTGPFGAGTYNVQIPTGTTVEDTDNLTLEINDNGEVQNRLLDRRGAAFVSYGERDVSASVDRDFTSRAEYDSFKAYTAEELTIRTEKESDEFIQFLLRSSIKDSFDIGLSGVGDLIRASTQYVATDTPAGDGSYEITVGTDEVVPLGP